MKWLRRYQKRRLARNLKRLAAYPHAQMIYSYLHDPSQREIARALEIPKTTVNDNIKILRRKGLVRGWWMV